MAKEKRKTSSKKLYHVTKRGVDDQIVFLDDSDRKLFIECLESFVSSDLKIHCYCLMSNHFHLLLRAESLEILAKFMKSISCKYVAIFNRKHNRKGTPFQRVYWSEPIDNWNYFQACFKYILRNPLEAGIAEIESYHWSSYKCYFSEIPSFIETALIRKFYNDKNSLDRYINNPLDDYINMRSEGYSQYRKGTKDLHSAEKKKIQNYLKYKYNIYNPRDLSSQKKCELIAEISRVMSYIPQKRFIEFFQIDRRTIASYLKQSNR